MWKMQRPIAMILLLLLAGVDETQARQDNPNYSSQEEALSTDNRHDDNGHHPYTERHAHAPFRSHKNANANANVNQTPPNYATRHPSYDDFQHQLRTGTRTDDYNGVSVMHSGNTPFFPSALGIRPVGLPTHHDLDLNGRLNGASRRTPEAERARRTEDAFLPVSPSATEPVDQGPLAPPPRSLMDQAGWWEYLGLLFGDAGDDTALRLILHRLSHLAQTQLGELEARRVQAATAFLAHHFRFLLSASFHDFVYDPDYSRRMTSWSTDPAFSAIIRRLVDKRDYFGAQTRLDGLFGPSTATALSYGMRQPEWLRLKLVLEQIAWDLRHPHDLIGLWSSSWRLSIPQKLSILAYAADAHNNAPLDANLPHRDLILARINLVVNGQGPHSASLLQHESPLDQAHYHFALKQANGQLCQSGARDARGAMAASPLHSAFHQRVDDYCELTNLTPTFAQFCQTTALDETPISALLSAARPLFPTTAIAEVNHLERLYWAFVWSGACEEAQRVLIALRRALTQLHPSHGHKVSADVADAANVRLEYMHAVQQTCQTNMQIARSSDVAYIFSLMSHRYLQDAMAEWEQRFSAVAARLEGYPGGSPPVSGDSELLYQQARDVRIALLLYKHPRAVYAPCLGRGLLTRDPATDLTLLNLADAFAYPGQRRASADPLISELSVRTIYLRALYLAGRHVDAARVAQEIVAVSPADASVRAILACTQLCGSATRNPCAAEKTFSKMTAGSASTAATAAESRSHAPQDSMHNAQQVGRELAARLCRLSRNTAADALSLRYGKVLTAEATFKRLRRVLKHLQHPGTKSALRPGTPSSVLPWFGILPPAPVDEILSYAPIHKMELVSQVGIRGMPVFRGTAKGKSNVTGHETAGRKILVLGKTYDADYLTGASPSEQHAAPRTKIVNGIFQLVSDQHDTAGPKPPASGAKSGREGAGEREGADADNGHEGADADGRDEHEEQDATEASPSNKGQTAEEDTSESGQSHENTEGNDEQQEEESSQ